MGKSMSKILWSIALVTTFSFSAHAQIKLIGASINSDSGYVDIVRWQALDSLSVSVVPTILDGYFFATSAYDALNSNYYLTGISGDSSGLYSYNSVTGEENLASGSSFTNIAEFDMSTGKMYNLLMETEEYISVYEYDILANQDSLIGIIYEPGVTGIVGDAIGFDSNNGIIYYVGFSDSTALSLYAIPVRDSLFSFTKTILTTTEPINNITSVNFDNVNEIVYALNDTYDSLFNFTGRHIVEIDKLTGAIINRGELVEFPYYVGGSSSFDQNSGTFLLVAIDTANLVKMVAFDTYTNTYVSGFVPNLVSEIVCDNSNFAKEAYNTPTIAPELSGSFKLYPNPVSEILNIETPTTGSVIVQIFTSTGKQVFAQDYLSANKIELNLAGLSPGLYLINMIAGNQTISEKILVQ
jgi:Secretion system C-terminal sorting domain